MANPDNPSSPGRRNQARRLAEEALQAERNGDLAEADRLFDQAQRADPLAVVDVLQEDETVAKSVDPLSHAAAPIHGAATRFEIKLSVNETVHQLTVDARTTLLDALRDRLHLSGTKRGCDLGQCGACTVLLDGRRINACLTLAVMAQGKAITTIEGLAQNGSLHPVQEAFIEHDAFQCGYCTPGQIMAAVGLIVERRAGSDEAIREQMSGNICRCGAYSNIVAAVRDAAGRVA